MSKLTPSAGASALASIQTQVMWNRLIAVVEEQAQSLLRTAFGAVAREAGDLSAGVYDTHGAMLAQAVTGTPGHVNTMASAVGHFLERFPVSAMSDGDAYVTNDPWMGTGHLFDFVVVTPAFRNGEVVALFASTCHVTDVGGIGFSAQANSVYEEGIYIPHLPLRLAGALNEQLLTIITSNTRTPVEVRGDLLSLITCNDTGVRRLAEMMDEFSLDGLEALAEHIISQSHAAARAAIAEVPDGTFEDSTTLDGFESAITIRVAMHVQGDHVVVDLAGSSPASIYGINSPRTYTQAYAVFGLKAVIAPQVPNNAGSLACFDVRTEPGSCVDPLHPSPVTARHVIGQMLPDALFGCLSQALPAQVPAESTGSIWVLAMTSAHGKVNDSLLSNATRFNVMNIGIGGAGARPTKDGMSVTAFPSGVGTIPIEVTESQCPLLFRRKEYLPDSGGAGQFRGGLGQVIEVANREPAPFTISAATFDRMRNPPRGRSRGSNGGPGSASISNGPNIEDKALYIVPAGESLNLQIPGGGGFGNPAARSRAAVQFDLDAGLISQTGAENDYGWATSDEDSVS
jgi:N-methylhydantoinase B